MKEAHGIVSLLTLSLTESLRGKVSKVVGLHIVPRTRAKIERGLWDIGVIQNEFIYIIEDEATEYFSYYIPTHV